VSLGSPHSEYCRRRPEGSASSMCAPGSHFGNGVPSGEFSRSDKTLSASHVVWPISSRIPMADTGAGVAVLGCGIDRDYPAVHAQLAERICERGLVVSEYEPGVEPVRETMSPKTARLVNRLRRVKSPLELELVRAAEVEAEDPQPRLRAQEHARERVGDFEISCGRRAFGRRP